MVRLRALLFRRLVWRLKKLKLFAGMTTAEVNGLMGRMHKKSFATGSIIMGGEHPESSVFFIISGLVRVEILQEIGRFRSPKSCRTVAWNPEEPTLETGEEACVVPAEEVVDSFELGPDQLFG